MAASLYQFDQQTQNFYEKLPFPIIIYQLVDGQCQVLLLSKGYCNMVKSDRASMMAYLGQHNLSRVHPEDRSRLCNFIRQVDQKKAHRLTYRLSIEGHYHQLLAYCNTQIDNGIKLFVVHYFDITINGQKLADQISPYVRQKTDQVDKLTRLKQIRYFEAYGTTFLKKLLAKKSQPPSSWSTSTICEHIMKKLATSKATSSSSSWLIQSKKLPPTKSLPFVAGSTSVARPRCRSRLSTRPGWL